MTEKIVTASDQINAPASDIFELIADPARQPEWDGNDNLQVAEAGHRVAGIGEVFEMTLTNGKVRENHVVEFEEGRRIAWMPASRGEAPAGHLWRWELEDQGDGITRVTHTYDWTQLNDESRMKRAQSTTPQMLAASITRLKELAES